MKPIISPWLIYFADKANNLIDFFMILTFIFGCAALVIWFAGLMDSGNPLKYKQIIIKSIIGCVLTAFISLVIPTTETVYTMAVANELTPDNIQAIGKTGKDVVDYITDQVDKVVNDKEEDKK